MSIANQHTQGDWTLHPRLKDVVIVDGDEANWVAISTHFGKTTAECHANGSIMAASPDLLRIAETLIGEGMHERDCPIRFGQECGCLVLEAIAAIAKARGQNV